MNDPVLVDIGDEESPTRMLTLSRSIPTLALLAIAEVMAKPRMMPARSGSRRENLQWVPDYPPQTAGERQAAMDKAKEKRQRKAAKISANASIQTGSASCPRKDGSREAANQGSARDCAEISEW